uniref:Helitron helicase-like domain-containing protein n=1 Tax=Rhizophagus irregularis (strain DAOM 181602 / DAOM 197198 / MUCL 43194) TaxID=747089 RepID=U9SKQ4_RHIID
MKNKKNLSQTAATIRQRKRRTAESLDERETRLTNDYENKQIKRSLETSNQREARYRRVCISPSIIPFNKSTLLADQYYADIIIDDNVLRTLPDEGSIDDLLPQVRDAENRIHHVNYELRDANRLNSETDNTIIRNFIPAPFPLCSENHVIDDALAHMQSEPGPVMWPNINDTAINKFNTPGLNGSQLTIGDIQEMMKDDNHMVDRVMRFGEGLRGTRQFWQKRSSELYDMIKQLGAKGIIFFTFSAADGSWRLEDYWYRYEWQHRGSVHVHGIGIMRDTPLFDWDNMKDNEDEMSRILSHFDSLVTTINPCPDAPVQLYLFTILAKKLMMNYVMTYRIILN